MAVVSSGEWYMLEHFDGHCNVCFAFRNFADVSRLLLPTSDQEFSFHAVRCMAYHSVGIPTQRQRFLSAFCVSVRRHRHTRAVDYFISTQRNERSFCSMRTIEDNYRQYYESPSRGKRCVTVGVRAEFIKRIQIKSIAGRWQRSTKTRTLHRTSDACIVQQHCGFFPSFRRVLQRAIVATNATSTVLVSVE